MSFDNNYPNRKDKRKPYRKSKRFDRTCRNHGSCDYCKSNRTVQSKKVELAIKEEIKAFNYFLDDVCAACLKERCNCIKEFEENELAGILYFNQHAVIHTTNTGAIKNN
jgi:hypothetical protein